MRKLIGVSSVWRSKELTDSDRLLDELLALGFDGLELEYRVGPETLRGMEARLARETRVLSVHAFFPNPGAGPGEGSGANAFLFSSPERGLRETAVRHGLETLRTAARLGAGAVVLHLGRVAVGDEVLATYRRLNADPGSPLPQLRAAAGAVLAARVKLRAPHLEAVRRSLEPIAREAERLGVLVGLENRFHPHEIPDLEESALLLEQFEGSPLRPWHDVGHALNQARLGGPSLAEWLDELGARLAGAHLHDMRDGRDHLAPGTGEADFRTIMPRLPRGALRIVEVRPSVSREELLASRELLRSLDP